MDISRERRGEIIAALRKGTVPQRGLDFLAVGLGRFESAIAQEMANVAQGGAIFKAVRGDYGCGKTFFARWVQENAKKKGFATAEVQISETETPLHRLETVYRRAMEQLSTADCFLGAFRSIIDGWFYGLEEDVLAEGNIDPSDDVALAKRSGELLEQRLVEITRATPQFAAALRTYRTAQRQNDHATAEGLAGFLDSVRQVDETADLRSRIDQARDRVEELEAGLSGEATSERLDAALRIIGDQITRWARDLKLEHSENPLQFDIKKLTVMSYRESGAIPLSEMGSGENWVGYHLTALLALHKWFVDKKRPVPHFLMIDQPAQYYFPADVRKDSDITALNDEDREAVRRMFQFIFNVVESLGGQFQIIITEHADLQDDWFQAAVVERWRGKDKLVPEHWYSSQTNTGSG